MTTNTTLYVFVLWLSGNQNKLTTIIKYTTNKDNNTGKSRLYINKIIKQDLTTIINHNLTGKLISYLPTTSKDERSEAKRKILMSNITSFARLGWISACGLCWNVQNLTLGISTSSSRNWMIKYMGFVKSSQKVISARFTRF